MKSLLKKLISQVVQNETIWLIAESSILRATRFIEWQRQLIEQSRNSFKNDVIVDDALENIFPDLTIKNGVFKGLRYPAAKSIGSTLFPKLLGSYEKEIQPLVEELCNKKYTEIVNIGCAEGYYAVGLAMRIPTAKVYAYDIVDEAINICKKMSEINSVVDRIILGSFCDPGTLKSIPRTGKRLIICDCEGYEKELFSDEVISSLATDDLLIEVHDFLDIQISTILRQRFETTHSIKVIDSIDDIKKAQTYHYKELEGYDLENKRILLGEHRPAIMQWFFLEPLNL